MKYIGKCRYDRINDWKKYLGSGTYLKRAILKYGRDNFYKIIIDEAYCETELRDIEKYYIEMFDAVKSSNFYNISYSSIGGDMFTNHPEKERIRKMRVAQMTGKGNNQYGKPKTEKMINSVKKANSTPISINKLEYPSIIEAERQLRTAGIKISASTICNRIKSENFPEYKRL